MKTRPALFSASMKRLALAVAVALAAATVRPALAAAQIDIIGPPGSGAFGTWVAALPTGNLVVVDPYYDAGTITDVGAVYLYDDATGELIGVLTGSTAGDTIGWDSAWGQPSLTVLSNGDFVVCSPGWDNGAAVDAGAVTWGNGSTGTTGVVSAANSLVGSAAGDHVGEVTALSDGGYVVFVSGWDNGATTDAGAVAWGNGTGGTLGPITAANSVTGSAEGGGGSMCWAYDRVNRQLVVGRPADNIVTLYRLPLANPVYLPVVLRGTS